MSGEELFAEPDAGAYAQHEAQLDAAKAAAYEDFDQFWAAQHPVTPAKIRGRMVTPPIDVPLALLEKYDQVQGSTDLDAIKDVLGDVFGPGTIEAWQSAGMGLREWQTVLAWAGAHMRGQPITFTAAYDLVKKAMAELEAQAGKAPASNRKGRRAAARGRTRSAAAGD